MPCSLIDLEKSSFLDRNEQNYFYRNEIYNYFQNQIFVLKMIIVFFNTNKS